MTTYYLFRRVEVINKTHVTSVDRCNGEKTHTYL